VLLAKSVATYEFVLCMRAPPIAWQFSCVCRVVHVCCYLPVYVWP